MIQILRRQLRLWFFALVGIFFSFSRVSGQLYHSELDRSFQEEIQVSFQYIFHIPDNTELTSDGKFPLILYLHGRQDRGDNLEALKSSGPAKIVNGQPKFPFAVLAPVCPEGELWNIQELDLLLTYMTEKHPIDPSRIYLTGFDIGGWAIWEWAWQKPEKFAALAPISGWGEELWLGRLRNLPIWIFHGALDETVPVSRSTRMFAGLKELQNTQVEITVFSTAGHFCSERVYNDEKLYEWFLSHSLNAENK